MGVFDLLVGMKWAWRPGSEPRCKCPDCRGCVCLYSGLVVLKNGLSI